MRYLKKYNEKNSGVETPHSENTDVETPPKWVKNPKSWAMDKIVSLLTPESKIHQLSTFYVESGVFNFKDLNKVKTFVKSIYQSSKDKKELDVYDHVRRFDDSIWQNHEKIDWNKVESYTGDKNGLLRKFHNLLSIIQPN